MNYAFLSALAVLFVAAAPILLIGAYREGKRVREVRQAMEMRNADRGPMDLPGEWVEPGCAWWTMAKVLGLMPDIHWNPGDRAMPGYGMRAALQSQNLLSGSLDRIFDELVVLGAVERGDDGRLRRRPEFDWQSAANSDDPEDRYRRPGSEPSGVDQPASPFGSAAVRGTRVD